MEQPLVSVLMPTFNAERFIAEAIESILKQTFEQFELIIVDDGSTDGTAVVVHEAMMRDRRIVVLGRANTGPSGARNDGIRLARAPYLAAMDNDDIAMPDRLQKQVAFMQEHPEIVALGGALEVIDVFGTPLYSMMPSLRHAEIDSGLLEGNGGAIPQPAVMLRAEAVRAVGGYSLEYPVTEDLDLFLRLAEVGQLANLPDVLVRYRLHPASAGMLRWREQCVQREGCVTAALRRRFGANHPPLQLKPYEKPSVAESYLMWGWGALKRGYRIRAIRHAIAAVRAGAPLRQSAILVACAVRGRRS